MTVVIWGTFIFQVVFMFIMMTNFLIAILCQSWDEVMDKHSFQLYESRCSTNFESASLMDAFGLLDIPAGSDLLMFRGEAPDDGESGADDFQGFVGTIKNFTKRELL